MVILQSPPMLQGSQTQQLQDVRRYLFRLVEQLNNSLNSLTEDNLAPEAVQALGSAAISAAEQTRADLKTLIIKNANEVTQTIEKITKELESTYVAKSDFGTFEERINNAITASAEGLEMEISSTSEILNSFIATSNGYIRQGVVAKDGDVPILGIALGQNISVTGTTVVVDGKTYETIDTSKNMSVWTTNKLSFYVNGLEVAHFANNALYVNNVETQSITFVNWRVDDANGLRFRWVGGTT